MNFIEKNTKKVAIILGVATAACTVTTVYAANNADGFRTTDIGRVYQLNGENKIGWLFLEEGSYYFDAEAIMVTGWQTIDGNTYYFDTEGKRVDGDVNGKVTIDGQEYTLQAGGKLFTGWQFDNTKYFNEFGSFLTGPQEIEGVKYNFNEEGVVTGGWQEIDGAKHYFNVDGSMVTGWFEVDGTTYYFNADGTMATSETDVDGTAYNFNEDGTYKTGWDESDNGIRYFNEYGYVQTGWQEIEGNRYYFEDDGYATTDKANDEWSFDANGVATKVEKPAEKETTSDASRSTGGSSSSNTTSSVTAGAAKGGIAGAAMAQLGVTQDCTALVSNSLAAVGINFHSGPSGYLNLGPMVSASEAQPGDIIVYSGHVAIYIGNGQAVHGGWNGNQTIVYSVNCSNPLIGYVRVS